MAGEEELCRGVRVGVSERERGRGRDGEREEEVRRGGRREGGSNYEGESTPSGREEGGEIIL